MTSKSKNKRTPRTRQSKEKAASNLRIAKLVAEAISGIEKRLLNQKDPPTIGDYLKLMQLQKDIEHEQPREIKVTWVEPESKKDI